VDERLEAAKEGAWREVAEIDSAYARGELDDEGWHATCASLVVPAYLAAETAQGGSGSSRDARGWEYARSLLADAVDPGQTFLDVGCANGLLMESIAEWAEVEPYGLEISPELVELARQRLPQWAERIWVGNALGWRPPRRFDVIRTGLDYVPPPRRRELVEHLLAHCNRLLIGVFNEERETHVLEEQAEEWGFVVAGRADRPHSHPRLAYRAFWIDS
jgi:SAM-dependent methyltransferase